MEFSECKICNLLYDEGERRPRVGPCGHELCSACVKLLIKDGKYNCPKCRKRSMARVPSDLPVNFGLMDAIRAFKTNSDSCKIHHKHIRHRCLKCQTWSCDTCLDSHSNHTGCSTISSLTAMLKMKEEHIKNIDMLLNAYDKDTDFLSARLQKHVEEKKELMKKVEQHNEEIKKIQLILDQGNTQKENLIECKEKLTSANLPYALMYQIEVLTQRKHFLHSWAIKNLGTDTDIQKAIKMENNPAIGMKRDPANSSSYNEVYNEFGSIDLLYKEQTLLINNIEDYVHGMVKKENFKYDDSIVFKLLNTQKKRISSFALSKPKITFNHNGILDFGIYLLLNGVPMDPFVDMYAYGAVWTVCKKANQSTPLIKTMLKEVEQHFVAQKEQYTRPNVKEEYDGWLKSYQDFLECAQILVYVRQQFDTGNLTCAITLIVKACNIHTNLINNPPHGPRKTVDWNVLRKYRRQCLLALNEKIFNSYETSDGQEASFQLNTLIIPALVQMSTSDVKEDIDAIQNVRNGWIQTLGEDISSQIKQTILKIASVGCKYVEFESHSNLPRKFPRQNNVFALFNQYIDVCRITYDLSKPNNCNSKEQPQVEINCNTTQ